MGFAATLFALNVITQRMNRLDNDFQRVAVLFRTWGESTQREVTEFLERAKQLGGRIQQLG